MKLDFVPRFSVVSLAVIETGMFLELDTKCSSNVSGTLLHFYFDQKTGENPKSSGNLKLLDFFIEYSIINAKLFFVKLSLCYLMYSKGGEPSLHC